MDRRLHRLDSFRARGSDGQEYGINLYEHLGRIDGVLPHSITDDWAPLGVNEMKLNDGRRVVEDANGCLGIEGTAIQLHRLTHH